MRLLAVSFALVFVSTGVSTAEVDDASLTYYAETIDLDAGGGAAITVRCCVTDLPLGYGIAMPYAHAAWPDAFIPGEAIREVVTRTLHGRQRLFVIAARDVSGNDTLEYRFTLANVSPFGTESNADFGVHTIAYRLVQSSDITVPLMAVRIVLPEGMVVNTIGSTTPARKANAPGSPYAIGVQDGRHCVTLTDSTVQQGDVLALAFEAKADAKSPFIIAALVLCAVAYLLVFRDLLKPEAGRPDTIR